MANGFPTPGRQTRASLLALLVTVVPAAQAPAQMPALTGGVASAAPAKDAPPASKEKAGETVATVSGPIKVETSASNDKRIEEYLEGLLRQVPGVRNIDCSVSKGVVFIDGQVDDDDTRKQIEGIAEKVEGLSMVINRLTTDAEVMTAPQLFLGKVGMIWDVVHRRWLLGVLALGVVMAFSALARMFNSASETLLAPFLKNVMLRSVVGSLISSAIVLGGLILGLSILNLTHAVLSVLGLASIVGLAVGFAFKDITENFIASVLLGVRRPFRVGDYVTVAGQTGVVQSLNTRATVLVTLEGNHIRIPNNIIYKEILVNATASPSSRLSFDVVVPYESSSAEAVAAMTAALHRVDGILPDPPARALVEALEPGGVRLRAYYWVPAQGADWFKISSDARLRVKVALQQARVLASPLADADLAFTSPSPALANLPQKDPRAANGQPSPVERAQNQADTRVSDEGTNLLSATGKRDG